MSVKLATIATFFGMFMGILAGICIGASHADFFNDTPKDAFLDDFNAEWVHLGDSRGIYHIVQDANGRNFIADDAGHEIAIPNIANTNEIIYVARRRH